MPRRASPLALLLASTVCACGGDDGGAASATTGVTGGPAATGIDLTDGLAPGTSTGGDPSAGETGGDDDGSPGGPKLDLGVHDFGVEELGGCEFIDVLFIVDISASMKEEKANLDANFPGFVAVLEAYVNDPAHPAVGYRIGVTNSSIVDNADGQSSMGLDGALFDGDNLFDDDCDLDGRLWIEGPGPGVADAFSCLAPDPKSSCNICTDLGKERPLDALEMFIARSAPGGVNEGFYRGDTSLFVVVILTDEDDDPGNTTTTPAQTRAALDQFAGGEGRHVVVTVAGPQSGTCESAFGSAAAAPTLHAFTELVPNGLMGDICQGDLTQALDEALALIQTSCDTLPPPVG